MITLDSQLERKVLDFIHTKNELAKLDFVIGGNWDYDQGSFDRHLDDHRTVWLRIPFQMTQGELDSEVRDTEARIQLNQPYVLKHLYEAGLDGEAKLHTYGALLDQFQEPVDKDAALEQRWLEDAGRILREAEKVLQ